MYLGDVKGEHLLGPWSPPSDEGSAGGRSGTEAVGAWLSFVGRSCVKGLATIWWASCIKVLSILLEAKGPIRFDDSVSHTLTKEVDPGEDLRHVPDTALGALL